MLIKRRKGWEIPEREVTPQNVFFNRRQFLAGGAALGAGLIGAGLPGLGRAAGMDPTSDLYPVARNPLYKVERPITEKKYAETFNNFYEFGSHKQISKAAQALEIRPWTVEISGLVEKPQRVDIDSLIRAMPLEERVYRFRCVEAWAMTVPWSGFPMKALLDFARPLSGAKYVRMETFMNPDVAGGQKQHWYPWPYVEGLTLSEAANDLAFMVTGVYGEALPKQYGAPLRLATPWKYGFKSIKSIVKFHFTDKRPVSFWEEVLGAEYGFWANVNPEVPHRRWSQASERILGTKKERPTQIYNGYGEFVADLYKGMENEPLFM